MNRFAHRVLFFCTLISLPIAVIPTVYTAFTQSNYPWLDEGLALSPIVSIYNSNEFSCRENTPATCYGKTQAQIDALTLKVFSPQAMHSPVITRPPGSPWIFLAQYPDAYHFLKASRIFYFLLWPVLLWFFTKNYSLLDRLCISFWPFFFPVFSKSTLDLKNDLPGSVWIYIFSLLSVLSFNKPLYYRALVLLMGVLGLGVRFTFVIPIVLLLLFYGWIDLNKLGLKKAIWYFASSVLMVLFAYFAQYTNIQTSLYEASWFAPLLMVSQKKASLFEMFVEFKCFIFPNFLLLSYLIWQWQAKSCVFFRARVRTISPTPRLFLFLLNILLIFSLWKSSWYRVQYYYFPIGASLAWLAFEARSSKWLTSFRIKKLTFLFLLVFWFYDNSPLIQFQRLKNIYKKDFLELNTSRDLIKNIRDDLDIGYTLLIDQVLRPGIISYRPNQDAIKYFDSVTESPDFIYKSLIFSNLKNQTSLKKTLIYTTCWKPDPTHDSIQEWSKVTQDLCRENLESFDSRLMYSHVNASHTNSYIKISGPDFLKSIKKNLILSKVDKRSIADFQEINPREMMGAILASDSEWAPVLTNYDLVLQKNTTLKPNSKYTIGIELKSSCDSHAKLTLQVNQVKKSYSLNSKPKLCAEHPFVCRLGLENWWSQALPVDSISMSFDTQSDTSSTFRLILSELKSPHRCKVGIQKIILAKIF